MNFSILRSCKITEMKCSYQTISIFSFRYEEVNVNLKFKPDWFLKRTLVGLVPVLEKDDKIVYESSVCDDYLDEVYPQRSLMPSDPYQKAQDRILMEIFSKVSRTCALICLEYMSVVFVPSIPLRLLKVKSETPIGV